MGTYRLGVFPSINNKYTQDKIAKEVVQFFVNKFPAQFFTHIYVDSEGQNANEYMVDDQGTLIKYESGRKIQQPNLRITIKQNGNTIDDAFGGIWNLNKAPGAHAIDTDLTGYEPFIYGPHGDILATNEYPIRNTIEIKMTVQSKADQLAMLNMLDTNVKHHGGEIIIGESQLIMPELMLEYLRSCLYKPEITMLSRMQETEDIKLRYQQDINKMFIDYLFKYSNGGIVPFRVKENNQYSGTIFNLNRRQRIYLRLEKPEPDDGIKKGSIYDAFNITISGYFDYANCVSFISSVPAIIRGTKNHWYIKSSQNRDKVNYYHTIKFKEVYKEERRLLKISKKYKHFYHEREIMMAAKVESFDLLDDIIDKSKFNTHYVVVKSLLDRIKTQDDFDKLFKVVIYKRDEAVVNFSVDEKFHFIIDDCDLKVPYYIDIFINQDVYSNYVDDMKKDLENYFGLDWNEPNTNVNGGTKWDILLSPQIGKPSQFVPIKPSQFIKPDLSFHYYINVKGEYLCHNDDIEANGFREHIDYYIRDEAGIGILIDTSQFMIPDNKYTFYVDNHDGTYSEVKNITKFDATLEYAIMIQTSDHLGISVVPDN